MIKLKTDKRIFFLALVLIYLLPFVFSLQMNPTDVVWVKENHSTDQEATVAAISDRIEVGQAVAKSLRENQTGTFQGGGHQMLQFSLISNSASFTRHLMCKDRDSLYNPVEPTTIFRPSDTKAVCLTTVSIKKFDTIDFRWYYRSDSSKTWVFCYSWSYLALYDGEHAIEGYLNIAGYWPGLNYPTAYKVEVYYLNSSLLFSEFFEVTNGGLNSPRICEDIDANGHPVNMKSRFTIGANAKAYHYLRFDKIAYFNEELGCCHNFTTVWIQPDGNTYKTYSGSFTDYKDTNVTWNYWRYGYTPYDYISINSSTPVGNWKVEVYLDSYYFNNTLMPYGPIATTLFIVGSEPVADWTFMVYLDADNALENASLEVFSKMASVGSSSKVNIVVQMDRSPDPDIGPGNWTDCYRFKVTKDMTPAPENATEHLGEVNMGSPDTLKDFVNWTINNYPANYYFLVLWDHGTGCMGVCFDITNGTDSLSLPELTQALSGLPTIMDAVLIDACSMSMTEVTYQIKDYANVLVGPEGLGYAPAPYDHYLSSLISNSSMSPSTFATKVVTDYIDWCISIIDIPNATMSATDLTKITSLTAAIDDFALNLKEKETPHHEQISLARNLTARYQGPYAGQTGYYIDLYHFAQLIYQSVLDEELRNTADQVMAALSIGNTIIIEADKADPDSHGMSIFFPDEKGKYNSYRSAYEKITFAIDTPWDELVEYHLSGYVLTIQTSYPDTPVNINETSYTTDPNGKIRVFVLPDYYIINLTTPVLTRPDSRRVFIKWNDGHAENPRTLFVNSEQTLEAEYETQYRLIIDANLGTTDPSVGEHWHKENSTVPIQAFAPSLVYPSDQERYVFRWIGRGYGSYSGTDNPASINMSGPINQTATWRHQYLLVVRTDPAGLSPQPNVSPLAPWYDNGTLVTCTAQKTSEKVFDHWTVNGTKWDRGVNPISFIMDGPCEVTAHYVQAPAWWENLFRPEILQVILGLSGAALTAALVRIAWIRTLKRRGVIKARKPTAIEVSKVVLPDRITSGYGDLDNLLLGGIPQNYAVILTSPACDERDLLIKKFLEAGAKEGQIAFYVTIEARGIRALMKEFQSNVYLFICNPRADTMMKDLPNVFKLKGVENLTEINIALTKAFRTLDMSLSGPRRACIEIVSDVLLQHHAVQTRRWLTDLISELRSRGFTTLAVVNPQMHPSEEVHAILDLFEGEINIYERETEKGLEKFLKIKKMYNQRYLESEMPLRKERLET